MQPLGTGKNSGYRPSEIVGDQLATPPTWKGTGQAGVFGLSATSAVLGVTGMVPTLAGVVGFAGAMYFVGSTVHKGAKKLKGKQYK